MKPMLVTQMTTLAQLAGLAALSLALGCNDSGSAPDSTAGGEGGTSDADTSTSDTSASADDSTSSSSVGTADGGATDDGSTGNPAKYDVGFGTDSDTDGPVVPTCKVVDDMDAVPPCSEQAPPDSFVPEIQWTWSGDGAFNDSIVTPLVANLTDDNGDGEIDLCDIPDIVVVVNDGQCNPARIYVLDGATGSVHYQIAGSFARASTPAIGDIDGDGIPEIVVQSSAGSCTGSGLAVYEHDGTLKWEKPSLGLSGEHAIALADVDNDGDVEILISNRVVDHLGNVVMVAADQQNWHWSTTTAADLDGDDDMEIVLGASAPGTTMVPSTTGT